MTRQNVVVEEIETIQKIKKKKNTEKVIYEAPDEKISCDKGCHKERSKANQPNHLKFWKKKKENE